MFGVFKGPEKRRDVRFPDLFGVSVGKKLGFSVFPGGSIF